MTAAAQSSPGGQRSALRKLHQALGNQGMQRFAQLVSRRVDPARVSCHGQAPGSPVLTAIGTDDPMPILVAADARAIEMLTNVVDELSNIRARVTAGDPIAWPLLAEAVGEAMRMRLRLDAQSPRVWTGNGPGTVEIVIRWYRNILNTLNGGRIRYICIGPTCQPGDRARSIAGIDRIRLCRDFWVDPASTVDIRALTLIHETSHIYYDTEDFGRGPGSAYCLAHFVADMNNAVVLPALAASCPAPAP